MDVQKFLNESKEAQRFLNESKINQSFGNYMAERKMISRLQVCGIFAVGAFCGIIITIALQLSGILMGGI